MGFDGPQFADFNGMRRLAQFAAFLLLASVPHFAWAGNLLENSETQARIGKAIWTLIYKPKSETDLRFLKGKIFFTSAQGHFVTNFHNLRSELTENYSEIARSTSQRKPIEISLEMAILINEFTGERRPIDKIKIISLPQQNYRVNPAIHTARDGLADWVIGKVDWAPAGWLKASDKPAKRSDSVFLPIIEDKGQIKFEKGTILREGWLTDHPSNVHRPSDKFDVMGAPGFAGLSGSPTLDDDGNVIGIAALTNGEISTHVNLESALSEASSFIPASEVIDCQAAMRRKEERHRTLFNVFH